MSVATSASNNGSTTFTEGRPMVSGRFALS